MKTFFQLIVLAALSILASCGQKAASKLLITSSSLTAANSIYEGGLVIMGKSGTKSFTIPVAHSSTVNGNKVVIELEKGTWTFSAVAWDGDPDQFEGTVLCDVLSDVVIKDDAQSVNLKLTSNKCLGSYFGDGIYNNGTSLNPLKIVTCSWLYSDSAGSTPVNNSTAPNYCTSSGVLPLDRRQHASSILVQVPNINGDVTSSSLNYCYSGSQGIFSMTPKQFPTKGLPLKITLFDNSTCDSTDLGDVHGDYFFPNGLDAVVADQDSVINNVGGTSNIFLSKNRTKKGFSSFLGLMPQVTCNGLNCTPLPVSIPSSADRVVLSEREFVLSETMAGNKNCSNLGSIDSSDFTITNHTCRHEDGKMIGSITTAQVGYGSITLNWLDATTDNSVNILIDDSYMLYDVLFPAFGYPYSGSGPILGIQNSFSHFINSKDDDFGILSRVRDIFDVEGPAGVLGNVSCPSATADKIISFYDDEGPRTYRIILSNSTKQVSPIEADAVPGHTSGSNYQKKMEFQIKDSYGVFHTMETVDFFCAYQQGIYESAISKNGIAFREKIFWNTQSNTASKVESYKERSKTVSGVLEEYRSEVMKLGNGNGLTTEAVVNHYVLELRHLGSNLYEYRPRKHQSYIIAGTGIRFLETEDKVNLTGTGDVSYSSTISPASPANDKCAATAAFMVAPGSACSSFPASFSNQGAYTYTINWNDLLPVNFSSSVQVALPIPVPIPLPI